MLTEADWNNIYKVIRSEITPTEIIFGEVIKRDVKHRLVWVDELGDQPIPLVGFNNNVTVYDVEPFENIVDVDLDVQSSSRQRVFTSDVIVPQVGEVVMILRQFGQNRLPHCIGTALTEENYDPDNV